MVPAAALVDRRGARRMRGQSADMQCKVRHTRAPPGRQVILDEGFVYGDQIVPWGAPAINLVCAQSNQDQARILAARTAAGPGKECRTSDSLE
jgi:hypothetical protein